MLMRRWWLGTEQEDEVDNREAQPVESESNLDDLPPAYESLEARLDWLPEVFHEVHTPREQSEPTPQEQSEPRGLNWSRDQHRGGRCHRFALELCEWMLRCWNWLMRPFQAVWSRVRPVVSGAFFSALFWEQKFLSMFGRRSGRLFWTGLLSVVWGIFMIGVTSYFFSEWEINISEMENEHQVKRAYQNFFSAVFWFYGVHFFLTTGGFKLAKAIFLAKPTVPPTLPPPAYELRSSPRRRVISTPTLERISEETERSRSNVSESSESHQTRGSPGVESSRGTLNSAEGPDLRCGQSVEQEVTAGPSTSVKPGDVDRGSIVAQEEIHEDSEQNPDLQMDREDDVNSRQQNLQNVDQQNGLGFDENTGQQATERDNLENAGELATEVDSENIQQVAGVELEVITVPTIENRPIEDLIEQRTELIADVNLERSDSTSSVHSQSTRQEIVEGSATAPAQQLGTQDTLPGTDRETSDTEDSEEASVSIATPYISTPFEVPRQGLYNFIFPAITAYVTYCIATIVTFAMGDEIAGGFFLVVTVLVIFPALDLIAEFHKVGEEEVFTAASFNVPQPQSPDEQTSPPPYRSAVLTPSSTSSESSPLLRPRVS